MTEHEQQLAAWASPPRTQRVVSLFEAVESARHLRRARLMMEAEERRTRVARQNEDGSLHVMRYEDVAAADASGLPTLRDWLHGNEAKTALGPRAVT